MSMIIFTGYLVLIISFFGLVLGNWTGAMVGAGLSLVVFAGVWISSPALIRRTYHTIPLHDKKIERMLKHMSHDAEIHHPRLERLAHPQPNLLVYGTTSKNTTIVLTDGILGLSKRHIRAALAYGVASIKLHQVRSSTLSAGLSTLCNVIPQWGYDRTYFWKEGGKEGYAAMTMAPLAGFPIRLTLTDTKAYKADWTAGLLIKDPEGVADLIRLIAKEARTSPSYGSASTSPLWLVPPFRVDTFHSWYSTHPSVEKRVETLEVIKSFHHSEAHILGHHDEHHEHGAAEHTTIEHTAPHTEAHQTH